MEYARALQPKRLAALRRGECRSKCQGEAAEWSEKGTENLDRGT